MALNTLRLTVIIGQTAGAPPSYTLDFEFFTPPVDPTTAPDSQHAAATTTNALGMDSSYNDEVEEAIENETTHFTVRSILALM